ncbi:hypothetical protein TNCT_430741 [Trichonephila clavata]|uniref:Uncharacterized protein n=1 Tax=Trichonephila clavata TaxID=2740835 RepID=A0A8X6LAP4_TRICU|nr:hypothetical protein TNCT_430741 [Trichonephila clavata]
MPNIEEATHEHPRRIQQKNRYHIRAGVNATAKKISMLPAALPKAAHSHTAHAYAKTPQDARQAQPHNACSQRMSHTHEMPKAKWFSNIRSMQFMARI